jgi:hypothetical protein
LALFDAWRSENFGGEFFISRGIKLPYHNSAIPKHEFYKTAAQQIQTIPMYMLTKEGKAFLKAPQSKKLYSNPGVQFTEFKSLNPPVSSASFLRSKGKGRN